MADIHKYFIYLCTFSVLLQFLKPKRLKNHHPLYSKHMIKYISYMRTKAKRLLFFDLIWSLRSRLQKRLRKRPWSECGQQSYTFGTRTTSFFSVEKKLLSYNLKIISRFLYATVKSKWNILILHCNNRLKTTVAKTNNWLTSRLLNTIYSNFSISFYRQIIQWILIKTLIVINFDILVNRYFISKNVLTPLKYLRLTTD